MSKHNRDYTELSGERVSYNVAMTRLTPRKNTVRMLATAAKKYSVAEHNVPVVPFSRPIVLAGSFYTIQDNS